MADPRALSAQASHTQPNRDFWEEDINTNSETISMILSDTTELCFTLDLHLSHVCHVYAFKLFFLHLHLRLPLLRCVNKTMCLKITHQYHKMSVLVYNTNSALVKLLVKPAL